MEDLVDVRAFSQILIPYSFWAKIIKTFILTNNVIVVE